MVNRRDNPRNPKRYKSYAEPDAPECQVPRTSMWNLINPTVYQQPLRHVDEDCIIEPDDADNTGQERQVGHDTEMELETQQESSSGCEIQACGSNRKHHNEASRESEASWCEHGTDSDTELETHHKSSTSDYKRQACRSQHQHRNEASKESEASGCEHGSDSETELETQQESSSGCEIQACGSNRQHHNETSRESEASWCEHGTDSDTELETHHKSSTSDYKRQACRSQHQHRNEASRESEASGCEHGSDSETELETRQESSTRGCELQDCRRDLHDLTSSNREDQSATLELFQDQSIPAVEDADGDNFERIFWDADDNHDIHPYLSGSDDEEGEPQHEDQDCRQLQEDFGGQHQPEEGALPQAPNTLGKHPKIDLFLDAFVDYISEWSTVGFPVKIAGEEKLCKAYLISCCVDVAARGSVQGIHSHSGEYGCNWCLHPGETEGDGSSARKFLILDEPPAKRTKLEVIQDGKKALDLNDKTGHVNGVMGLSPLLRALKFNIVDGMIVDVLHWANFGIGRQIFKIWMGLRLPPPPPPPGGKVIPRPWYIGSPETQVIINARIRKLRPPKEVRRMPRDISVFVHWNAREWENFILYYSIPVLKNILPQQYLRHWTLFVQSLYLLLRFRVTPSEVQAAEELLWLFVSDIENLYSWKEMTYNVHISEHAAENVRNWGPMWCISTFAFENGNGNLKRKIHAERGMPHQIIRSLNADSSLKFLRDKAKTHQTLLFQEQLRNKKKLKNCFYVREVACLMPSRFAQTREESWLCGRRGINTEDFVVCKKIIVNHHCYSPVSSGKTDNSFVYLKNEKIVKIRKIISSEMSEEVYLFVSKVMCSPFSVPILASGIKFSPFMFEVHLIQEECELIDWTDLSTVCVHVDVQCKYFKGNFISVMSNTMNIF